MAKYEEVEQKLRETQATLEVAENNEEGLRHEVQALKDEREGLNKEINNHLDTIDEQRKQLEAIMEQKIELERRLQTVENGTKSETIVENDEAENVAAKQQELEQSIAERLDRIESLREDEEEGTSTTQRPPRTGRKAVSYMRKPELQAELAERGLSTEGYVRELRERVKETRKQEG
jgi:chromosome segregation ATPase